MTLTHILIPISKFERYKELRLKGRLKEDDFHGNILSMLNNETKIDLTEEGLREAVGFNSDEEFEKMDKKSQSFILGYFQCAKDILNNK